MNAPASFTEQYELDMGNGRIWRSVCKVRAISTTIDGKFYVDRWDDDVEDYEEVIAKYDAERNVYIGY